VANFFHFVPGYQHYVYAAGTTSLSAAGGEPPDTSNATLA